MKSIEDEQVPDKQTLGSTSAARTYRVSFFCPIVLCCTASETQNWVPVRPRRDQS